jgi:hypothetical protein
MNLTDLLIGLLAWLVGSFAFGMAIGAMIHNRSEWPR